MHIHTSTYIHTYVHTYILLICLPKYIQTCLYTYIHAYQHAYTCTHSNKHTKEQPCIHTGGFGYTCAHAFTESLLAGCIPPVSPPHLRRYSDACSLCLHTGRHESWDRNLFGSWHFRANPSTGPELPYLSLEPLWRSAWAQLMWGHGGEAPTFSRAKRR